MADQHPPEPKHDSHQEYESDRRGEHKYPESQDDDRPSQRERDELKKRMERGR